MIVNEHIEEYINSMESGVPAYLEELEAHAIDTGVPIIRRSMQTLLRFLLIKEKPKRILEIGAAIGFSSLFMKEYAPKECEITTIEKVEMRLVEARKNLAGVDGISLIEGDAAKVLEELASQVKIKEELVENDACEMSNSSASIEQYDWCFLDAAKGQYMSYLPSIVKLVRKGGLLITDNVLLEGSIAESKFAIERRDRTIHMRMREYLYELTHRDDMETVILPVGDGVTLSYMK